jgi:hypothetical protein
MGFHEQAGDADRHRRARQHRHELALAARGSALPARQLHRVGGVIHHRAAGLAQDGQAAHVGDEVVVAEGGAALAHHDGVRSVVRFLRLGDDVLHVVRGEELALLDVGRLARGGDGLDEIGLAAEEGRRLQHVDDRGDGGDLATAGRARRSAPARRLLRARRRGSPGPSPAPRPR